MSLLKDRKTAQLGTPDSPSPLVLSFPVAAATTIYAGAMVATDSSGNAVPAAATSSLKIWGRAKKQVVNTVAAGFGGAADLSIEVERGAFFFDASGSVTESDVGKLCYAVDDKSVATSDSSGTRPLAGIIFQVDSTFGVGVLLGGASQLGGELTTGTGLGAFFARGVGPTTNVSDLTAFTVASNDGLTYVAGDQVLLYAQTAAKENGPYVVGTVAVGVAPLTRPTWWPDTAVVKTGAKITVGGEGTLFGPSDWKVCAASAAIVVGTDSAALFPRYVGQQVSLTAGVKSITNVPVLSATKSTAIIDLITATTATSTTMYTTSSFAASTTGAGTVIVISKVNGATLSTLDGSTLNVGICNW